MTGQWCDHQCTTLSIMITLHNTADIFTTYRSHGEQCRIVSNIFIYIHYLNIENFETRASFQLLWALHETTSSKFAGICPLNLKSVTQILLKSSAFESMLQWQGQKSLCVFTIVSDKYVILAQWTTKWMGLTKVWDTGLVSGPEKGGHETQHRTGICSPCSDSFTSISIQLGLRCASLRLPRQRTHFNVTENKIAVVVFEQNFLN